MTFSDKIKRSREVVGLTQQELADRTGMKQTFIQKLEKQQANFTAATLIKTAWVLNCSLSDLLDVDLPEQQFPDKFFEENIALKEKLSRINELSEL